MRPRFAVTCALLAAASAAHALPSFSEVKVAHRPSDVTLLDRHGTPIQTLRIDNSVRRLPWVALADMSPALLRAVLLSEDRNFYAHGGIDWAAVARSAWGNAWDTMTLPLESVPHSRVTNWLAWVEPQASFARTASG